MSGQDRVMRTIAGREVELIWSENHGGYLLDPPLDATSLSTESVVSWGKECKACHDALPSGEFRVVQCGVPLYNSALCRSCRSARNRKAAEKTLRKRKAQEARAVIEELEGRDIF